MRKSCKLVGCSWARFGYSSQHTIKQENTTIEHAIARVVPRDVHWHVKWFEAEAEDLGNSAMKHSRN